MPSIDVIKTAAHRVLCGTNHTPNPDDGCVGCGATADAHVTVGCQTCRAPGETFCWACLDSWPADAPVQVTAADLTVFPGRHR